MNDEIFQKAKSLFSHALCCSGMDESCFDIVFDSDLVDDENLYAFLLSLKLKPHNTDEGMVSHKAIIFEVCQEEGEEDPYFVIGEDTPMEINYGNVFSYMYFYSVEDNASKPDEQTG